jgi:hypothetical protein
MSDEKRTAAELMVVRAAWRAESYSSDAYASSIAAYPHLESALKLLRIPHTVEGDKIIVSGIPNVAELYDCGADLPGFEDKIQSRF